MNPIEANLKLGKRGLATREEQRLMKEEKKKARTEGLSAGHIWCDVCELPCPDHFHYEQHVKGSKHLRKLQLRQTGLPAHANNLVIHCEVCKISCIGVVSFQTHLRGRAHLRKLLMKQQMGVDVSALVGGGRGWEDGVAGGANGGASSSAAPTTDDWEYGRRDWSRGDDPARVDSGFSVANAEPWWPSQQPRYFPQQPSTESAYQGVPVSYASNTVRQYAEDDEDDDDELSEKEGERWERSAHPFAPSCSRGGAGDDAAAGGKVETLSSRPLFVSLAPNATTAHSAPTQYTPTHPFYGAQAHDDALALPLCPQYLPHQHVALCYSHPPAPFAPHALPSPSSGPIPSETHISLPSHSHAFASPSAQTPLCTEGPSEAQTQPAVPLLLPPPSLAHTLPLIPAPLSSSNPISSTASANIPSMEKERGMLARGRADKSSDIDAGCLSAGKEMKGNEGGEWDKPKESDQVGGTKAEADRGARLEEKPLDAALEQLRTRVRMSMSFVKGGVQDPLGRIIEEEKEVRSQSGTETINGGRELGDKSVSAAPSRRPVVRGVLSLQPKDTIPSGKESWKPSRAPQSYSASSSLSANAGKRTALGMGYVG